MATLAAVGRSNRRDSSEAGRSAARDACVALGEVPPDLLLVFATAGYDQNALLKAVREVAPESKLAGCSGEGIIAHGVSDESDRCVAVMAIRSDTLSFEVFLAADYAADPVAAGEALAAEIRAASRGDEFGLLVFPDGLQGNCGELLRALDRTLQPTYPVVGGTAGDALMFLRTHQYANAQAVTGAISAVLLRGPGVLDLAVSHGCVPIGLERRVTRAEGGWMREIDGQPAWQVFREYLDGDPEDLNTEGAIHLSVGEECPASHQEGYEPYLIRTPLGLDKESGAMFFPGGGIAEGGAIRLTRRDPGKIRESARASARRVADRHAGRTPALVLQFDCAARGKQLFGSQATGEIVTPLQEEFEGSPPWIGFHTYGEIAPIGGRTYFHNFTVALCAIYESR